VNAPNDALCAGISGREAMTFRSYPRVAPRQQKRVYARL
jgi:hypothetical protein